MKKAFLTIVVILLCDFAFAAPHLFIFSVNGINTDEIDAIENAKALELTTNYQKSNMVKFDYIWNPTSSPGQNIITNLIDVAWQKADEYHISITLDDYTRNYIKTNGLPDHAESSSEYKQLKTQMKGIYLDELTKMAGMNFDEIMNAFNNKTVPVEFQDVLRVLREANSDSRDNYVMLISHSQGGLYTNALAQYQYQSGQYDQNNLVNYEIATPATEVIGGFYKTEQSNYVTSGNDFVIGGLRVISKVLPKNADIPFAISSPLGHNLVEVYLNDAKVVGKIATVVKNVMNHFIANINNNLRQHGAKLSVMMAPTDKVTLLANNQQLCGNGKCDESKSLYYEANDKSYYWYLFMADKSGYVDYKLYSQVGEDNSTLINLATFTDVSIHRIICKDNKDPEKPRDCVRTTERRYQTLITAPQSNLDVNDLSIAQQKYPTSFNGDMILGREWFY